MNAKSIEREREREREKRRTGKYIQDAPEEKKKLSKGKIFSICIRKKEREKKGNEMSGIEASGETFKKEVINCQQPSR